MNVLHISPRLRPGGVNQLAADLACGMQQAGYRNTVISPPNELVGRMTAASVQHHSSRNIAVFTFLNELKRVRRLIAGTRADIILAYTTPAAYLAWKACHDMPEETKPRIIGIHTTYPQHPGWASSLGLCDALVSVSRHLRNELVQRARLNDSPEFWVIPYGVNEELCHPGYRPTDAWLEQWLRHHKEEEGTLSICIPGAITPLHGLEDLTAILGLLNAAKVPVHVYIAGDTENTPEMMQLQNIDIAFLPVNQPYTMTVDQAAEAVHAIRPAIFYPYHYGQVEEKTNIDRLVELVKDITDIRIRPME